MLRYILSLLGLFGAFCLNAQTGSQKESILLNATVQSTPASITLNWPAQTGTTGYTVYRKLKTDASWGSSIGTVGSAATIYQDNGVAAGTYYEYKVVRAYTGGTGYGYIAAGIQVPATDFRGKMVLLVDNTFITSCATQLTQLETDLKVDGWIVLRSNVDRNASVTSVRGIVQGFYNADPTNVKAVYIVGHVPVPYSGNINPDGHGDHLGAWPCDGYYGEMNGTWTDNSVNSNGGQNARNHNSPGDGKFDQSDYPSVLELQVGRIDFYEFESFQYYAGLSETQLTINYLNKAHQFKAKLFTPTFRGAVFDNFDDLSYALAGSGYKSIAPLVGNANFNDLNPNAAAFSTYVDDQSYLWTYACRGGTWTNCANVGSTGEYANNIAMGGVFNMTFGSYFGDWNSYNNFLKAPLGSGKGLTNVWAGIPNWWFHHMGMGDNIGYSTLATMNNTTLYVPQNPGWQGTPYSRVHLGLMGDPSLRQLMVPMPSNLQVTNNGGIAAFAWTTTTGVDGYFVYDMGAANGIPVRLNPTMVTGSTFSSPTVPFISGRQYMVRAVKMETTPTGTYQNLSLGVLGTASGQAAPDCLGVLGGNATIGSSCNDNNACTTNDVYNASCVCMGTTSADSDGDGICNAQDNCPNVAGQIGSTCNDGNACTTNDVLNASCVCVGTASPDSDGDGICNAQDNCPNVAVLNASCVCVGTASPDSDGDGICNAQDNCPNVAGQIGSTCNDGNACTTNDVLNASCVCVGTASPDSDGDGICNAQDNCPNVAGQIGSTCNDGNACTTNDVLNASCACVGTASPDSDGDGICNAQDNCPNVTGRRINVQ
ncbi:MAG: fibronectin type III domain-containing protein [Flavobacteriales bacterium]|nr:fibronectin type III domain-containing protein [Flavobacteriales bacterium]